MSTTFNYYNNYMMASNKYMYAYMCYTTSIKHLMSKIKIGVFKDKFFFFKNTMEISALYFYSNVIYMLKFFENPFSIQKKTNFCTNSSTLLIK